MLNIDYWIKLPKSLGISQESNQNIYDQAIGVFENVEYKISKIKKNLAADSNFSIEELDAFQRYMKNLNSLLIENWRNIVVFALDSIIENLEGTISSEHFCVKKIKKSILCCKKINKECKIGNTIKPQYLNSKIKNALEKLENLSDCLSEKVQKKVSEV